MRINETPPITVTRPETRGPVAQVAGTSPVGSQNPGSAAAGPNLPERDQPVQRPSTAAERRQAARRNDERRKQKLSVMMDTRIGQRRTVRRRNQDQAAASVDVQA